MSDKPLWAEIQKLLNRLVDRIERAEKAGNTKAQVTPLNERIWPELYQADVESLKEELWKHVIEMCRWGWLTVTPNSTLHKVSGYDHSPKIQVRDEALVRAALKRPARIRSGPERWREAVAQSLDASEAVRPVVSSYCIDIPGRSMDEVVQRLGQLSTFADKTMLLREVSAKLFWGMSKLLDNRQPLVAAILGVDECPFPASPIQLQVYLPLEYRGVLFIENQMSFERALRASSTAFAALALVYAAGFKGSAQRLRNPETCSLFYSQRGSRAEQATERFENWLFSRQNAHSMPAWFWGDLDYAGMRILAAMRRSISGIEAWEIGYAPMLKELEAGQGHHPEAADKAGQKPIEQTGCQYADRVLLPAIRKDSKFIDQEIFHWSV
jgi:sarcosine oxidase delta subunit